MIFKGGVLKSSPSSAICPSVYLLVTVVGSYGTQPGKPLLVHGEILPLFPTAEQSQILQSPGP